MANTEFLELPLTGLDKAFAKFLEEAQPSLDNRHSLLAAMASHQFGRGHADRQRGLLHQRSALQHEHAGQRQHRRQHGVAAPRDQHRDGSVRR